MGSSQSTTAVSATPCYDEDKETRDVLNETLQVTKEFIDAHRQLIETKEAVIRECSSIRDDMKKMLNDCKISNTVGNASSIVGTGLLFTPFFFFGVGLMIGGSLTSVGTFAVQQALENNKVKKCEDLFKREKQHEELYIRTAATYKIAMDALVRSGKAICQTCTAVKLSGEIKKTFDVLSTFKVIAAMETEAVVAYNGVKGLKSASTIWKAASITTGELLGAGLCVVVSAVDIVLTWTVSNETLSNLSTIIKNKKNEVAAFKNEFNLLK